MSGAPSPWEKACQTLLTPMEGGGNIGMRLAVIAIELLHDCWCEEATDEDRQQRELRPRDEDGCEQHGRQERRCDKQSRSSGLDGNVRDKLPKGGTDTSRLLPYDP